MTLKMTRLLQLAIVGGIIGTAATAQSAALSVAGSPAFDPRTKTGMKRGVYSVPGWGVNNVGTAVGCEQAYVGGADMGGRAVRWDAAGIAGTELGNLGTDASGKTDASAWAVNDAGLTVGHATKYVGGTSKGTRAVRWDATGTLATELGYLGTDANGSTNASAYAVNGGGMAVGYSAKYVGGSSVGNRAVRWNATGTAATELGILGADSNGSTYACASAVNGAGTIVGYAMKYVGGTSKGARAVRWNAGGTAATELETLGTDSSGFGDAYAIALNDIGIAAGYADKYVNGSKKGTHAVRWDAWGTAATELGNLGTDGDSYACAVNGGGTVVGYAQKFSVGGTYGGCRAVRWNAGGTAATELGTLGTDPDGYTEAYAAAVNDAGAAVGYARKYAGGGYWGDRAVIWLPDASAIDLNDLGVVTVPAGGTWTLTSATAISADGYVVGEGIFDPGGSPHGLDSYTRLWAAQIGLGGTWTKASGGTWGRGPNWSTGTPAMQVGNAVFSLNSAYAVTLDRNEDTKSISVAAGSVTLDLSGHALVVENDVSIAADAALAIGGTSGTFQVSGNVANAGRFEVAAGENAVITGNLTGAGETHVHGNLTVSSLTQESLVIGGTSVAAAVPEPGTVALLGVFAFGAAIGVCRTTCAARGATRTITSCR